MCIWFCAVTGDLYFITAYYAIRAPRVPGTNTRGPIRFHKAMAWIHGPGMILTPILGVAYSQKSNGEKVHGIAAAHGPVAFVTSAMRPEARQGRLSRRRVRFFDRGTR